MARLRLFCRLRGIELEYRRSSGHKVQGLCEALLLAARPRGSQIVVVVSDLDGLGDRVDDVLGAARLARARHHRLLVVAPFGPAFAELPDTPHARQVAAILSQAERREIDGPRRALENAGVPVVTAGREDSPAAVIRRWQRLRTARSGGLAA
jgi:DNA invertase Pin-like site-specific DNA recombinase